MEERVGIGKGRMNGGRIVGAAWRGEGKEIKREVK